MRGSFGRSTRPLKHRRHKTIGTNLSRHQQATHLDHPAPCTRADSAIHYRAHTPAMNPKSVGQAHLECRRENTESKPHARSRPCASNESNTCHPQSPTCTAATRTTRFRTHPAVQNETDFRNNFLLASFTKLKYECLPCSPYRCTSLTPV